MLIKCPECELQVSDKAMSCPHCGYPMKAEVKQPRKYVSKRKRLPNGFGQITEIKGQQLRKPFRVMITVGFNENGRPKCVLLQPVSYFKTYNDAYQALIEHHKNPYDVDKNISIEELHEKWFADYIERHPKGTKYNMSVWDKCKPLYRIKARELRTQQLKDFIEKLDTSANVKIDVKTMFSMMYKFGISYEYVEKNIVESINLSESTKQERSTTKNAHTTYEDWEIEKLRQSAEIDPMAAIILIQCYMGWRPAELFSLEVKNIDIENWTIKGGMKTTAGKDRIVPIHESIQKYVSNFYNTAQQVGDGYLFHQTKKDKNGATHYKQFTSMTFTTAFHNLANMYGLNENHRPHDGRVFFITNCKKCNVDEYAIKRLVGHSISDITEKVYTKRDWDWLKSEISKLK